MAVIRAVVEALAETNGRGGLAERLIAKSADRDAHLRRDRMHRDRLAAAGDREPLAALGDARLGRRDIADPHRS
jgi:hypothetical protein